MKASKPADYHRHQQAIRKPGPVKRLTKAEIAAMEHRENLMRYLSKERQ